MRDGRKDSRKNRKKIMEEEKKEEQQLSLIYVKDVCDQLTEVLGLRDRFIVATVLGDENDQHIPTGWCIVKKYDDGTIRQMTVKYETIKDLLEAYDIIPNRA